MSLGIQNKTAAGLVSLRSGAHIVPKIRRWVANPGDIWRGLKRVISANLRSESVVIG